jgi:hypothetical protein
MAKLSLFDRVACAVLGAMFGALYGAIIGLIVGSSEIGIAVSAYVKTTCIVFAILGFAIGPFVGDVIAAVLHFLLGIFALDVGYLPDRKLGLIWSLFWVGAGTFIAILLVQHPW